MTRNILTFPQQDSRFVAATAARLLLGLFFVLSGIANYLHFSEPGGLLETLTTQKLKLWGLGFESIGPLPGLLAMPYAHLLPAVEIGVGVLFLIDRWVKWAGLVMLLMLASFILAFGLFPKAGLLPSNESTWDKNVFIMLSVWLGNPTRTTRVTSRVAELVCGFQLDGSLANRPDLPGFRKAEAGVSPTVCWNWCV